MRDAEERRRRATALITGLMMERWLNETLPPPAGTYLARSREVGELVVMHFVMAGQFAAGHYKDYSSARQMRHLETYSQLTGRYGEPRMGWLRREARRQYRELHRFRRRQGEVWRMLDDATWADAGWRATDLLEIGSATIDTANATATISGEATDFRIWVLGEARRRHEAGLHPDPFRQERPAGALHA